MIARQPQMQMRALGESVYFSIEAGGSPPLTYRWGKDGNELVDDDRIAGSQSATLTISSVERADAGEYVVVVTNAHGSVTSTAALLVVGKRPAPPRNLRIITVGSVDFE